MKKNKILTIVLFLILCFSFKNETVYADMENNNLIEHTSEPEKDKNISKKKQVIFTTLIQIVPLGAALLSWHYFRLDDE